MKKWVFILGLILLIGGNNCWATAIVQTTDYISFPVVALDSVTGVECVPESVHIHVWRGSLTNTTVYSFRETGDGADLAQIDSVATGYAGAVPQQYYFHDQVQDIDGDGTAGVYTINVRLWRGTTPTSNWFSFQVVDSSFNFGVTHIGEIEDEIAVVDGNVDNIVLYTDGDGSDGIDADLATVDGNVDNIVLYTDGDDSDGIDAEIAAIKAKTDNLPADPADDSDIDGQLATIDDYVDTEIQAVLDTINAIIDTLQLGFGSRTAIGDTANQCDMVMISGDATAADNCEYFFDGTGITQDLDIKMRSFYVESDVGIAMQIKSSAGTSALDIDNTGGGGEVGVYVHAASGAALDLDGTQDILLEGSGRIHGTIDSCAGPAYAGATLDTIRTHAPHGDNWAAGTGVSAIADTVNAILDTLQAHAPHGDDWSGSGAAGADTSDIKSMIQKNWDSDTDGELTVEPSGVGARTVVIQCLDYIDSTTGISNVDIDVYDSTAGEYKMALLTNTSGVCTLSLDDATYAVHLKKTADAIDGGSPKYPIVSSDTTLTYYIDQFDPGAPPSADKCRVWCLVYDLENNPIAGARLTIQVPGRFMPLVYDGTPVSRYTVSAVSNDTGYVFIDVYEMEGTNRIKCQADTSLTVKANIELRIPNKDAMKTYKAIPDATDWEITW